MTTPKVPALTGPPSRKAGEGDKKSSDQIKPLRLDQNLEPSVTKKKGTPLKGDSMQTPDEGQTSYKKGEPFKSIPVNELVKRKNLPAIRELEQSTISVIDLPLTKSGITYRSVHNRTIALHNDLVEIFKDVGSTESQSKMYTDRVEANDGVILFNNINLYLQRSAQFLSIIEKIASNRLNYIRVNNIDNRGKQQKAEDVSVEANKRLMWFGKWGYFDENKVFHEEEIPNG